VPLGRGEPLVLTSSVASVALLAPVLRQRARCARRLTCATRTYHSLLSVLPLKELRELTAVRPRDGERGQLCQKFLPWRDLVLLVARGALVVARGALVVTRATLVGARATLRVTSCRFCQKVSRL